MNTKKMTHTTPITALFTLLVLAGCTSSNGRNEKLLLPDAGATTVELMTERSNPDGTHWGGGAVADYIGSPIVTGYAPNSSYTAAHVRELQRDFKRVPNPDVVGYVYPHINANEMPVSGYFTTFKLYNRDHFALTSEGYNVQ